MKSGANAQFLPASPPARACCTLDRMVEVARVETPRITRAALVATVLGNALEFYDFMTYAFFSLFIGRAFFPTNSELASLLLSVATFGIGFLTRPLGGVWIGSYADRAGRKPALLLTLALMAVGTLAIVVTPSYASIGLAAPIILVLARLVQGLALGGEVGPASAVLVEAAPPGRRALYVSLQSASQGAANASAGLVGILTSLVFGADQLASWAWRLPFAVGLLIVPIGLYLRRALPETLEAPTDRRAMHIVGEVWREHRRSLVLVVLVGMCLTIGTYVGAYMTTYAQTTLGLSARSGLLVPIVTGALGFPAAMWSGNLCDRFGRRRVLIVSRVGVILLSYPAFVFVTHERTTLALVLVVAVQTIVGTPSTIAGITVMTEIFPKHLRAAGMSLAYSIVVTVFGSTTQFVVAWLIGVTRDPLSPSYYVIATSAISIGAMLLLPETRDALSSPGVRAARSAALP